VHLQNTNSSATPMHCCSDADSSPVPPHPDVFTIMQLLHSRIPADRVHEKLGSGCIAAAGGKNEPRPLDTEFGGLELVELFEFMDIELEAGRTKQLPSPRLEYVRLLAVATTRYMGNYGMNATMAQAATLAAVLGHSMLLAAVKQNKVIWLQHKPPLMRGQTCSAYTMVLVSAGAERLGHLVMVRHIEETEFWHEISGIYPRPSSFEPSSSKNNALQFGAFGDDGPEVTASL
jgi:hypothetical protein